MSRQFSHQGREECRQELSPKARTRSRLSSSIDTTIAGNDLIGNWVGVFVIDSHRDQDPLQRYEPFRYCGDFHGRAETQRTRRSLATTSRAARGASSSPTLNGGSFAGNTVHDNCAGMFFEALPSQPVGGFEVKGNTVENNTRSCRAAQFDRNFSGIGIALLGASGMEVTGNHLSGNVPSGPTRVSGGVVVSTDPFFGGTTKPRNNSVTGNHFGRNKPDIFWDESGSGNRFVGNLCNTSVPSSLCN